MPDWRVAFSSHDSSGTLFINTICVHDEPSSGGGLSAQQIADEVASWLSTPYRTPLGAEMTLDTITARQLTPTTGAEGVHAVGLNGLATASDDLPREMCVVLSFKTAHATRRGRGHILYPGNRSAGAINGSLWATGTAWWTALDTLVSALAAGHDYGLLGLDGHLSHRVFSRLDNAAYDVTSIVKRTAIRWVERRQTAP